MKRYILSSWLVIMALVVNACHVTYSPLNLNRQSMSPRFQSLNKPINTFSYKANVKPVNIKSQIVKITPQQVIFKSNQNRFKAGDILFGRFKEHDLLRRIVSIKKTNSTLILTTQHATLFDAFEQLDVSGFTFDNPTQIPKEIVVEKEFAVGKYLTLKTKTVIKPDLSKFHISLKNKTLRVVFNPSVSVDSDTHTRLKVIPDMPLKTLQTKLPPPEEVGKVIFKTFFFKGKIGPVPVRIAIKPGASLDLASQARGEMLFQSHIQGFAKAGFVAEASLNSPPFYNLYKDYTLKANISEPKADLDGAARLKLNIPDIRISSQIASFNGPYLQFKPFVDGDVEKTSTVKDKHLLIKGHMISHLGLSLVGGMKATKLFGKKIIPEFRKVFVDKQLKEIYRRDFDKVIPIP